MNKFRRSLCLILSLVLMFSVCSVGAFADDESVIPEIVENTEPAQPVLVADEEDTPADELLMDYMYSEMWVGDMPMLYSSSMVKDHLSGTNLRLYNLGIDVVNRVTAGELDTAEVLLDVADTPYAGPCCSAEDLGLEDIFVWNEAHTVRTISQEAKDALNALVDEELDLRLVRDAVRAECPYEMYWAGSTYYTFTPSYNIKVIDGVPHLIFAGKVGISFTVSRDYADLSSADSYGYYMKVDRSKTSAVASAISNARQIVADLSTASDLDKLTGYMERICALTDYNYAALDLPAGTYGDPWQIINVFDDDPDSLVVCEGYAKSFQFLCENTVFDSEDIRVYSVIGDLCPAGGGGGAHMWNIVHMDNGKNYLVDVTGCDQNWGIYYDLFLAVPASGSVASGYTMSDGSRYIYDSHTIALFTNDELTLADRRYFPPAPMTFEYYNLVLSGEIGVNFYVSIDEASKQDGYMEFDVSGVKDRVDFSEALLQADGTYKFTCYVNALQMGNTITATYYGGGQSYTKEYSVVQYVKAILQQSHNQNMIELAKAIIDYGYFSQMYLSSVKQLSGSYTPLTGAYSLPTVEDDLSEYAFAVEGNDDGLISDANFSLNLDSSTEISVFFKYYGDGAPSVKVNGKEVTAVLSGTNTYTVFITGIPAHRLADTYTVTIDDTVTCAVSVLSYVYAVTSSGSNVLADYMAASIYNYYTATMNYKNSK